MECWECRAPRSASIPDTPETRPQADGGTAPAAEVDSIHMSFRALAVVVLIVLAAAAGLVAWRILTPTDALRTGPMVVEIVHHEGVADIAERLRAANVIPDQWSFVVLTVARRSARRLKAGEYEIAQGSRPWDVLRQLESGRVRQHTILQPEGATVLELARALENERLATADDVSRAAADPALVKSLGLDSPSLEGYLFPDTYQFVRGMTAIFNETPIRQGRRFWHYGKDFETVKKQFSRFLYREELLGAYYHDELVGFVMLGKTPAFADLGQIISKVEHRDKAVTNALIAKAVEVCCERGIGHLVYAFWTDDSLGEFKRQSGFREVKLPRYYVPLTLKGRMALRAGAHRGLKELLPTALTSSLKRARRAWYQRQERGPRGGVTRMSRSSQ